MKRNYEDPVYKSWRYKVYKRDKFKCQMPGCSNTKYLQAHHIEKWSSAAALRYDIDNGITLCRRCHSEVNKNEHHYKSLFISIIKEKYG